MREPDRVALPGGMAHWPETLREVARAANVAGLEGFRVADVTVGLDPLEAIAALASSDLNIPARIVIRYEG